MHEQTETPYSLGKLIEWKPNSTYSTFTLNSVDTPYSLGKLIEWKHVNCS
jgi:hypothetical protein